MQDDLNDWFVRDVLPLEGELLRYLRRHWRDPSELNDLRQEVYVRAFESARQQLPEVTRAFVFTIARNLLIDRARRAQIVAIDSYAELERDAGGALADSAPDLLTPERHASGRAELRLLEQALSALPLRCQQVVRLRKIEGLSQREVAQRMGIGEDTVEKQIAKGMRALADALLLKGIAFGVVEVKAKAKAALRRKEN